MIRSLAMLSGIVLALGLGAIAWAAPVAAQSHPCTNMCVPNAKNWGYFPTTWRQWPGERRLEEDNPKAIGSQVLPTPEGREQVPLSQAAPPRPPAAAPQEEIPLPPGGLTIPPEGPLSPMPPTDGKPATPPAGGGLPGLPGLPGEPEPPRPTPTQSEEPKAASRLPSQFQPRETPPEYRASAIGEVPQSSSNRVVSTAFTAAEPTARPAVANNAVGLLVLNGYCVVEHASTGRWVPGDPRWTVVHKGLNYRFSGPAQQQQFLANPDAFAPANSGNDTVLAVDEARLTPGWPAYCATYNGRLYLFANAATLTRFNQNPQRYTIYAAGR